MNSFIESLNLWGDHYLTFAWPMLWQSSLLIAVLFAIDFALRRRLRPAVRYTLWLVLLLKLLMPPSLALPTSIAWWLRTNPPLPQRAAEPQKTFVVTYGDTVQSEPLPVIQHVEPPRPKPSTAAWLLAGGFLGSVGLLGILLIRCRQITVEIRKTESAPDWTEELFSDVRRELNWRQPVRLRLTDRAISPAVCGFFRPTILLPRALIERLEPNQLRAVLLHELIHLRRGDVWVNCAQALLQVAYWWHPLLWLANARIRRVREEAVDDAVMLALRDNAENYAPTLLEVAKLAFSRPLASLGLVGILESRNALRQRIERLVNFRAPHRAGLTLTSLLAIAAFAAVAVPMNKAPESTPTFGVVPEPASDQLLSATVKVDPSVFIKNVKSRAPEVLRSPSDDYTAILLDLLRAEGVDCAPPHGIKFNTQTGEVTMQNTPEKLRIFQEVINELNLPGGQRILLPHGRKVVRIGAQFYKIESQQFDELGLNNPGGPQRLNSSAWLLLPEKLGEFKQQIASLGLRPRSAPQILTAHGTSAKLFSGDATNSFQLECLPFILEKGEPAVELATVVHTTGWFNNNPAGDWPTVGGHTNCAISTRVGILDNGGAVLRAVNPDGKPQDNLVVLIEAKLVSETKPSSSSQNRATPKVSPGSASVVPQGDDPFAVVANSGDTVVSNRTDGQSKAMAISGERVTFDVNTRRVEADGNVTIQSDGRTITTGHAVISPDSGTNANVSSDGTTVVSPNSPGNPDNKQIEPIHTRTFKVDTNTFYRALVERAGLKASTDPTNISQSIRTLFSEIDIELQPPKSIYFNYRNGMLLVRATLKDLDTVEQFLQVLNSAPPQVNIKVKFVEIPEEAAATFIADSPTNRAAKFSLTGILTQAQFQKMIQSLERRKDVEIITGPEVTTLSGRQAQIQMVDIKTIVNGLSTTTTNGETKVVYETKSMPFGQVLDVIPHVSADGYTIQLTAIPTVTEFLGYDDPNEFSTNQNNNPSEKAQLPLPHYRERKITTSAIVWDGQTLVLGNFSNQTVVTKLDGTTSSKPFTGNTQKKQLFVFITPTLVDPAGNRVHTAEEMPFAREGVPPQPK